MFNNVLIKIKFGNAIANSKLDLTLALIYSMLVSCYNYFSGNLFNLSGYMFVAMFLGGLVQGFIFYFVFKVLADLIAKDFRIVYLKKLFSGRFFEKSFS